MPIVNSDLFQMMRVGRLPVVPFLMLLIRPSLAAVRSVFRSRAALELEILALRHQICVLQRTAKKRPRLKPVDRFLWVVLCRIWRDWRSALAIVKPETVIGWHRKGFRLFWTWKVRCLKSGRPGLSREVRDLIRRLRRENPLCGAPHIHGELLKLGIDISETSVGKCMFRHRKPPSQTWPSFLHNHIKTLVSVDFFTVPTIRFEVLYVFLVLAHDRHVEWFISMSPLIQPPNGPSNSCERHFRLVRSLGICCAIATRSSARISASKSPI